MLGRKNLGLLFFYGSWALSFGCALKDAPAVKPLSAPPALSASAAPPKTEVKVKFRLLRITSAILSGQRLLVRGKTDLPTSSRVVINFDIIQQPDDTSFATRAEANVKDDAFEASLEVPQRPEFKSGPYVVDALFTPNGQNSSVLHAVGENGENLQSNEKKVNNTFWILTASKKISSLSLKLATSSIPSPDQYPQNRPERTFLKVINAWARKDWQGMSALAPPSWRSGEQNPTTKTQRYFDVFIPFGVVGPLNIEERQHNTVITVTLDGSIGSDVQRRTMTATLSKDQDQWLWDPLSLATSCSASAVTHSDGKLTHPKLRMSDPD